VGGTLWTCSWREICLFKLKRRKGGDVTALATFHQFFQRAKIGVEKWIIQLDLPIVFCRFGNW
jgi:hypothetical protein